MALHARLPQELLDLIIKEIDGKSDLGSCSLVNSNLRIPSQRRLWNTCTIRDNDDRLNSLAGIVHRSPHIVTYIKSFKFEINKTTRMPVVDDWINQCLTILGPGFVPKVLQISYRRTHDTYLDGLHEVLSHPCFREVASLWIHPFCLFRTLLGLHSVIAAFPRLDRLQLHGEWDSAAPSAQWLSVPQSLAFKSITIFRSPRGQMGRLYSWLAGPPSFESLRRLMIWGMSEEEQPIVAGWLEHLRGLEELTLTIYVTGTEADDALHLSGCPRLKELNVIIRAVRGARIDSVTTFVGTVSSLHVRHIALWFWSGVRSAVQNRMNWSDLDAQIDDHDRFPSLQSVTIAGWNLSSTRLGAILPRLKARNLLAIGDETANIQGKFNTEYSS